MRTMLSWLKRLTALATIAACLGLAWMCISLYLEGNNPANLDARGVHLMPVFTVDKAAQKLQMAAPFYAAWGALVLLTMALRLFMPEGKRAVKRCRALPQSNVKPVPRLNVWRTALYGLALLFILLGVMNGGLYDVLVKAINICTECIGIG